MRTIKALVLSLSALTMTGEALSVMTVGALLASPVQAKDTLSAKVGKVMQDADKAFKAKDYKGAMAKLQEAQAIDGKTDYEKQVIAEYTVAVAAAAGDTRTALKALEQLVSGSGGDPKVLGQRLKQLSLFNFQDKNYDKAIQYGNRYLKEIGPDADISTAVTQAYYQKGDYQNAAEAAQGAIKAAQSSGQPVKEGMYQIQLNSYTKLGRNQDAINVLERLLDAYPKKEYWKIAINNVESSGGLNDRGHVEINRLKRAADVLDPDEMVEMAEMAMAVGVPGEAKSVLEAGFDSKQLGVGPQKDRENRLLTKARNDSAEDMKTLDSQAKQAASAAKGDFSAKLGEAYATYGQNDKAVELIKAGIDKGVTAEDEARLHLGQALFASKKYSEAVAAFKKVPSDSKYARIARLWATLAANKK